MTVLILDDVTKFQKSPKETSPVASKSSVEPCRHSWRRFAGVSNGPSGFVRAVSWITRMSRPPSAVEYRHSTARKSVIGNSCRFTGTKLTAASSRRYDSNLRGVSVRQWRCWVEWLARSLVCDGDVVAGPLDPSRLADSDLRNICLRMHVILETIEMPRCEGRLIPVALFDALDTLEGIVLHGNPRPPRLAEWSGVVHEFGEYYQLAGSGHITVDSASYHKRAARYSGA